MMFFAFAICKVLRSPSSRKFQCQVSLQNQMLYAYLSGMDASSVLGTNPL
jgi:hypothetical protein